MATLPPVIFFSGRADSPAMLGARRPSNGFAKGAEEQTTGPVQPELPLRLMPPQIISFSHSSVALPTVRTAEPEQEFTYATRDGITTLALPDIVRAPSSCVLSTTRPQPSTPPARAVPARPATANRQAMRFMNKLLDGWRMPPGCDYVSVHSQKQRTETPVLARCGWWGGAGGGGGERRAVLPAV